MKRLLGSLGLVAAGLVAGSFLIRFFPAAPVEMRYSDVGDAFLVMHPNDRINFTTRGGAQDVTFKGVAPCEDAALRRNTCKIRPQRGLYFYECAGCPDPGIAVGTSGTGLGVSRARDFHGLSFANPRSLKIVCAGQSANNAGTPKIPGDRVIRAPPGSVFEIYPVGDFDFSIKNAGPGFFCNEQTATQPTLNNDYPTCTVKDNVTVAQIFTATVTNCGSSADLTFTVGP